MMSFSVRWRREAFAQKASKVWFGFHDRKSVQVTGQPEYSDAMAHSSSDASRPSAL